MATTITAVLDNLETVIKAITPTITPAQSFRLADWHRDPGTSPSPTGGDRTFFLTPGACHHAEPFHPLEYTAVQEIQLTVVYNLRADLRWLYRQIRQDVNDLKHAVDLGTNWIANDTRLQQIAAWSAPYPDDPNTPTRLLQDLTILVEYAEAA